MKVFQGRIVTVEVETVKLPNGNSFEMEVIRHPGGAAVVALDEGDRVCVLRQYRPVIGRWVWEIPAGKIDPAEPPLETARRELTEEAGMIAARWEDLGSILSSPGIFTERIYLFLARGLTKVQDNPQGDEVFEVHWLAFPEALRRARGGEIEDAKSVAALMRAAYRLGRD
jgi:8-oxo-dGTP pyrophosphatase MutT (NUDIX family)